MKEMITLLDKCCTITNNFESDYIYDGKIVPRVTKIISSFNIDDGLMKWANSLGFKHQSYIKTLAEAAMIGTLCHNNIDEFMEDNKHELPPSINNKAACAYNSFRIWFDGISKLADVSVIFHEKQISCKYFGGTLDGFYKINGKNYLIDYKTSNHIRYSYFLQIAAYRYMLREELGINTDGCIVLQLNKNNISFNEYALDFSRPEDLSFINTCEQAFLSLVYAYYNITNVNNIYKTMRW